MRDWWIAAARIALVAPIPPARPDAAALLAVSLDEIRSVSTACVTACCVTLDARSMRRPKWRRVRVTRKTRPLASRNNARDDFFRAFVPTPEAGPLG